MFDETKIYMAGDPVLRAFAPYSTLAHWRSEGRGPAYIKIGSRVAYRGTDLNRWLLARTVVPAAA